MDFRRIDKNTVQCILSEEEMNAYGFQVEDFFSNQEKSRDFLEHIVERAEEEVGYESKGGMVSMQIMKMPNNDLAITFSERDREEGFLNVLQQLHQLAGLFDPDTSEQVHNTDRESEELVDSEEEDRLRADEAYQKHMREVEKRKREKEKQQILSPKAYRFEKFHDLEQFAASLEMNKPITSTVYRDANDNSYYLLIRKGRLKMEEYQFLCQRISEFAVLGSEQPYVEQFCKEHFEVFIPKQAVRILKQIETGVPEKI